VGHGDVGDGRRNVLAVVQEGDDPGVEALQAATVMLKGKNNFERFCRNVWTLAGVKPWTSCTSADCTTTQTCIFPRANVIKLFTSVILGF
jgi:hypothetical protein